MDQPSLADRKAAAAWDAERDQLCLRLNIELDHLLVDMRAAAHHQRTPQERMCALALAFAHAPAKDLRRLLVTALARLAEPPPPLWRRVINAVRNCR